MMLPEEFGGAGFGPEITAAVIERIAQGNASVAVTLEGHFKTLDQFLKYGTSALKAKYFPTAGERIFAFSMTEASGGSNPMGIQTTAVRQGDGWLLNGNKVMITNGGLAEVYAVLAKTAPDELSVLSLIRTCPDFNLGSKKILLAYGGHQLAKLC